jgi:hypothetical protein
MSSSLGLGAGGDSGERGGDERGGDDRGGGGVGGEYQYNPTDAANGTIVVTPPVGYGYGDGDDTGSGYGNGNGNGGGGGGGDGGSDGGGDGGRSPSYEPQSPGSPDIEIEQGHGYNSN